MVFSSERFLAESFALNDFPWEAYTPASVAEISPGRPTPNIIRVTRTREVGYECLLDLSAKPVIRTVIHKHNTESSEMWREFVDEYYHRFLLVFDPVIAFLHPVISNKSRLPDEDSFWDLRVAGDGARFQRGTGIGGLAMRTYISKRLVDLIGADALAALPAPTLVDQHPNGSVTVRIHPNEWQSEVEEFLSAWRDSQKHLEPTGFFSRIQRFEKDSWDWLAGTSRNLFPREVG